MAFAYRSAFLFYLSIFLASCGAIWWASYLRGFGSDAAQYTGLGSNTTTVVTGYYKIPSKYPSAQYLRWIQLFMMMDFKVIIFTDEPTVALLKQSYPETYRRKYIIRPLEEFETNKWSWEYDKKIDLELNHSEYLYKIWNEKAFMVADVASMNPFQTETFSWVDIGCFRDYAWLPAFRGFPDNRKFNITKVTFLQVTPFNSTDRLNLSPVNNRFQFVDRIGGGHFAGSAQALLEFRSVFRAMIDEFKAAKVFAGKDQSLFAYCILRNPQLFDTVHPAISKYDKWMSLHLVWSSSPEFQPVSGQLPLSSGDELWNVSNGKLQLRNGRSEQTDERAKQRTTTFYFACALIVLTLVVCGCSWRVSHTRAFVNVKHSHRI